MIKTATNDLGTTKRCRIVKVGRRMYRIYTEMQVSGSLWVPASGPMRISYPTEDRAYRAAIRFLNRFDDPPASNGKWVEEP